VRGFKHEATINVDGLTDVLPVPDVALKLKFGVPVSGMPKQGLAVVLQMLAIRFRPAGRRRSTSSPGPCGGLSGLWPLSSSHTASPSRMTNFTGKGADRRNGARQPPDPRAVAAPDAKPCHAPGGQSSGIVPLQFLSPSGPVGTLGQDGGDKD
jgi:hypothetical protein